MAPIKLFAVLLSLAAISGFAAAQPSGSAEPIPGIKDGIDVATGFVAEGDYMIVRAHCTACHSSKLVLQNRATRDGWKEMIRWMQATQKLWDLGENEDKILDYLSTYYAPTEQGRRAPLKIAASDWYQIEAN